uniref:Uncharacterized protein n=1 Tax=Meloidogyne hapla TaxID=6305 RepID=A0A1I8B372_MELHA
MNEHLGNMEMNLPSNDNSHTSGPYHYTSEHEMFQDPNIPNVNILQNELLNVVHGSKGNEHDGGQGGTYAENPWNASGIDFNESSISGGDEFEHDGGQTKKGLF